jgi:sugar diacid utilization regulator
VSQPSQDVVSTPPDDYQRRTRELEALFETARDLSALRDVDEVLAAIVRRSRQLLGTDVAYLMLLDEPRRETYMRVGEGIQTPEFMQIRLGYGEGLGGLVADTAMPQWTDDYQRDERFAPSIDAIVRAESLKAILGVPLKVGSRVTGVLLASDRRRRGFTHDEVALLSSLASHAAIALENASLFESSQESLRRWQEASTRIEQHNRMLERAAALHETLTSLVLHGASLPALAEAVAEAIGGRVVVLDAEGGALTPRGDLPDLAEAVKERRAAAHTDGSVELSIAHDRTVRLAPARAGTRPLGYLAHLGAPLASTDVRALERAALVTALLLLDRRAHDEARIQAMTELLDDVEAHPGMSEQQARGRARAAGLALPDAPYVALVAVAADAPDAARRLEAAVQLALEEGYLVRVRAAEASLLLPAPEAGDAARRVAARLTALDGRPVTVGATGPHENLVTAVAALPRARTCARVLESTGQRGRGATPEELGVYTLLFSEAGRDQIEGFVAETLGPVQAYDAGRNAQLGRTLAAYFDTGGQTGRVAEALFIHVNTLYQRLERLDRLLGEDWRYGERSLQVHLAVRLDGLLHRAM